MDHKNKTSISKRKCTFIDLHEMSLFLNEKKDFNNWDEEKKEVYFQVEKL
jgi:hypothetical protein